MHEIPTDLASTTDLTGAIETLLPALEAFLRFEGNDPAARRTAWAPLLDEPLPIRGPRSRGGAGEVGGHHHPIRPSCRSSGLLGLGDDDAHDRGDRGEPRRHGRLSATLVDARWQPR